MHKESTSFEVMLRATFNDASVTAIEYRGKPAWIASDVGRAIGLAEHKDAARRLRERKAEGVYWHDATPDELAAMKNGGLLTPLVNSATLILEPGLYWLLMTADTERAESFREWLAEEHLPALRTAASAEPPKQLASPVEQVRAAVALDACALARAFSPEELDEQAKLARVRLRREAAARKERELEEAAAARREQRIAKEMAQRQAQAVKAPRSTLW